MSQISIFSRLAILAVLAAAILPLSPCKSDTPADASSHPPIPIRFTLKQAGFVTLVIEDASGKRVRNLVSESPFPAGDNTAWWDGMDDLGRDTNAASHAIYNVPGQLVTPGAYRVRGLVRPKLDVIYRMTPYTNGNPPWALEDKSSEWLANHTSPSAMLFLPAGVAPVRDGKPASSGAQMLVASRVSEGGSGLAWLDMQGNKVHGQMWIGGAWTGATSIARDVGDHPVPGQYAYTGSAWHGDGPNSMTGELRLNALTATAGQAPRDTRFGDGEDRPVLAENWRFPDNGSAELGGLAVRNGIIVASLPRLNELVFIDASARSVLGTAPLDSPRGLAFDRQGRLLAVSGKRIVRFAQATSPSSLSTPETVVAAGLDEPQQVAVADTGNIYISDWGNSHQVKVFTPRGAFIRVIGLSGVPALGPYNSSHMHFPNGIALDGSGRLWVAETDKTPKRISIWSPTGEFLNAFYGPHQYGGGGSVDPVDSTRYYYTDEGGDELKLDWQKRTATPVAIYFRPEYDTLHISEGWGHAPGTPIHFNGHTYLTSCFTNNPTNGSSSAAVYILENGIARPVAAAGKANEWPLFGVNGRFSMRWTGYLVPRYTETYKFSARADDGIRVVLDGKPIIERWTFDYSTPSATVDLVAGRRYPIRVDYTNEGGGALVKLMWQSQSQPIEPVPPSQYYTTVTGDTHGLTGEYFGDKDLGVLKATQVDPAINFDWGNGIPAILTDPIASAMRKRIPAGINFPWDDASFVWVDKNGDGKVQPDEVTVMPGTFISVNFMPDLSITTGSGLQFKPQGFSTAGVPLYDASHAITLVPGAQQPVSSGGGQAIVDNAGNFVLTTAPKPFAPQSVGGGRGGVATWSYPSLWPGLHASHNAAMPDRFGELIGTTRLLGNTVTPTGSDAGEIWAINGNKGNVYLMTTDGLFVATLFRDSRTASWNAPAATPGMNVSDLSLNEESFWPSISQTADGHIYLQGNGSLLEIEGLEGVRRIADSQLSITASELTEAQQYFVNQEVARQAAAPSTTMNVTMRATAPTIDGNLDDWSAGQFVTIDSRVTQVGDWGHTQAKTTAALCVSGDKLFVALKTDDPALLANSGEAARNMFKTGGGIDIMLGTNPNADAKRTHAVPGDERLLVTQVKGKTAAVLYQQVSTNAAGSSADYASPLRSVHFDNVTEVSDSVSLASQTENKGGASVATFEFSIPLSVIGLTPQTGATIKGDIGILRGNGFQTLQRAYWADKATGLVSDLPSEAELLPQLWGQITFTAAP